MARLRGTIEVTSQPGQGTRITVRIPCAPAHAPVSVPRTRTGPLPLSTPLAERTVLLVDDDPAVRRALARTLTRAGFVVTEASDGREALAALPGIPHLTCVVTDIVMPNLDGRGLAAELATRMPTLPVILISGNDVLDEISAPRRLFLPKPVSADVLLAAITHLVA